MCHLRNIFIRFLAIRGSGESVGQADPCFPARDTMIWLLTCRFGKSKRCRIRRRRMDTNEFTESVFFFFFLGYACDVIEREAA